MASSAPPTCRPAPPPSPCLQLVILLDFIYAVNEWLLDRDHCAFVLVAASALLIIGSFVGLGFLYKVGGWVG